MQVSTSARSAFIQFLVFRRDRSAAVAGATILFIASAAPQVAAQVGPVSPAPAAAPRLASPEQALESVIERLISDLASPDYSVREAATEAMKARADLGLAELEQVLTRPGLTPEQRVRLQSIARERFSTTPRGAMGVRFGGVLQQSRIVIDTTYEGFAAHGLLEPGDMIVAAEGRPLRGDLARYILRAIVFAHDPGDVLPVTVRRGDEKLEMDLRLGSYDVLSQQPSGRPLDELDLSRAWAMRKSLFPLGRHDGPPAEGTAEVQEGAVEPIATTLPAAEWPSTREQLQQRYKLANARLYGEKGGPVQISAGGRLRGEGSVEAALQYGAAQPTNPLEVLTRSPTVMRRQRELSMLTAMEARWEEELQRLIAILDSPDMRALPKQQREQTAEMIEQYRERLQMVKLERTAIEAEQREMGDEEPDADELLLEQ